MENKKKSTEIVYIDEEKNKAIVSSGNKECGYSFFESKLRRNKNNKVVLSSVKLIDNIFNYIEDNNIDISKLEKIEITKSVNKNEKVK